MSRQCLFQHGKDYLSKTLHFFSLLILNESFKTEGISTHYTLGVCTEKGFSEAPLDLFFFGIITGGGVICGV